MTGDNHAHALGAITFSCLTAFGGVPSLECFPLNRQEILLFLSGFKKGKHYSDSSISIVCLHCFIVHLRHISRILLRLMYFITAKILSMQVPRNFLNTKPKSQIQRTQNPVSYTSYSTRFPFVWTYGLFRYVCLSQPQYHEYTHLMLCVDD